MQHEKYESFEQQRSAIADILANAVVRLLAAQADQLRKDSPKLSHIGLSSSANDRSL